MRGLQEKIKIKVLKKPKQITIVNTFIIIFKRNSEQKPSLILLKDLKKIK